jgi:hypothetical protein
MKHMTRTYKKEDAMLRPEHTSTLDKAQAKRQKHNPPKEENVGSKDDIINKKINERLKRKEMMGKEYDKWAKSQLDPTLDK